MNTFFKIIFPAFIVFLGYKFFGNILGTVVLVAVLASVFEINKTGIYVLFAKLSYLKNNERMFNFFERAYQTGKMTPEQKLYYGYMCMREGRMEKAEKMFGTVLAYKQKPEIMSQARLNNALVLWKKGNLKEAIEVTEEVFKDYKTTVVYGNLGFLLLESGDFKKALEFNKEAYEYNGENDVIADNLAQTYYKMGDYEKSREIYDKVIKHKLTSPTLCYNIAKTLSKTGETELAVTYLKNALNMHFAGVASVDKETVEKLLDELERSIDKTVMA